MTTRPDTQPRAARTLQWLALPILLLAGCVSVPPTTAVLAPEAPPVVVAAPVAAAAGASAPAAEVAAAAPAEEQVAAPVPVDPLRPEVRLDLDARAARVDLWERVRRGFSMPDLDSDLVRDRERWYATRPDYVARMTERGGRYLFHIVEELDKRGMPTELALLPFIESAYNPQAMSVARASGMWQFIPSTGRDFELKQNVFRDDRRDVLASTRAALDYLQKLYGMFGDWHLALAAYNWGEGSVQRAIAKNQRAGRPTDYMSLRMPAETQGYVPKLQAVKNIVSRPASFNLQLPELYNHPVLPERADRARHRRRPRDPSRRHEQRRIPEPQSADEPAGDPRRGTPQILLPYDNANRFVRELPQHRGPLTTWTTWIAPRTMKSAEAAHAVGMPEEEFREVNRIPARMVIKSGSTLVVPRRNAMIADVSSTVADNATIMLAPDAPPLRKVSLRAGKNDSVDSVAKRYRVSPAQVAEWNSVGSGARFPAGKTIVVYVPNKARPPTTQASTRSGGPRSPQPTRVATGATAKGSKPTKTTVTHKHVVAKN
jgi:membrane-bound lytic murein transglycosylase D